MLQGVQIAKVGAIMLFALGVLLVFPHRAGATFMGNQPPTADPNGPYMAIAGDPIFLDGSGSSDPDGDPLTFEWDLGADGIFNFFGDMPLVTFSILGISDLVLRVTDDGGLTDEARTTVEVLAVPIPEPSALALFAIGLAGLGFLRRRRNLT